MRKGKSGVSARAGFTLIELLIVIAIIALLTGIILTSLSGSKAKSRDAKRASDLAQIQLAIEQYFDRCDQYPQTNIFASGLVLTNVNQGCPTSPNAVSLATFISQIPTDPTNTGNYVYYYTFNSNYTDYVLHATFETTNSASAQSATAVPTWFPSQPPWPGNASCNTSTSYCVRPN